MHDDELTAAEREALWVLPREANPSDLLEERTLQALVGRDLVRSRRRSPAAMAWIGAVAACLVFFVAGFGVGMRRAERPADESTFSPSATEGLAEQRPGSTQTPGAGEQTQPAAGEHRATPAGAAMDTAGGLALTSTPANQKQRTQVVVWF